MPHFELTTDVWIVGSSLPRLSKQSQIYERNPLFSRCDASIFAPLVKISISPLKARLFWFSKSASCFENAFEKCRQRIRLFEFKSDIILELFLDLFILKIIASLIKKCRIFNFLREKHQPVVPWVPNFPRFPAFASSSGTYCSGIPFPIRASGDENRFVGFVSIHRISSLQIKKKINFGLL